MHITFIFFILQVSFIFLGMLSKWILVIFLQMKYIAPNTIVMDSTMTAMTSNSRYWYHVRSSAADRRCGAPPYLMMYSDQKMAVSSGVLGRSRNRRESF
jgi:hypothetical protein